MDIKLFARHIKYGIYLSPSKIAQPLVCNQFFCDNPECICRLIRLSSNFLVNLQWCALKCCIMPHMSFSDTYVNVFRCSFDRFHYQGWQTKMTRQKNIYILHVLSNIYGDAFNVFEQPYFLIQILLSNRFHEKLMSCFAYLLSIAHILRQIIAYQRY